MAEENLPELITRASKRLSEAKTSGEVLEAKKAAQTALHYAKLSKAVIETQADCLKMIIRAEIRMDAEITAGQERGEVAKAGGDRQSIVHKADNGAATLDSLGVTRQERSEWKKMGAAGQKKVDQAIDDAVADGRVPSKAEIHRAVDPNVNPAPPEGFAEMVQIIGWAEELTNKLNRSDPQFIIKACAEKDIKRLLKSLANIRSWEEQFTTNWKDRDA